MRLKLDENLGDRGRQLLAVARHDVSTVHAQDLCDATDNLLIEQCNSEQRCLASLKAGEFKFTARKDRSGDRLG